MTDEMTAANPVTSVHDTRPYRLFQEVLATLDLLTEHEELQRHPERFRTTYLRFAEKLDVALWAVMQELSTRCDAYLHARHLHLSEDELDQFAALLENDLGLGGLETFLNDPAVTDIMVNGPQQIYIERTGRLYRTERTFATHDHLMRVIDRLLALSGQHADLHTPIVDGRLPDDSLLQIMLPPLALDGPSITIRKFKRNTLTLEDLIGFGALTAEMAELIKAFIVGRFTLLVSGGTGSGKTTVLHIFCGLIPAVERIVTIEETAILQIPNEHVVRLEARPPDSSGRGAVTTRDLVRAAARMRPERIIITELQGSECLDALQLIGRGHDGSMLIIHANSAEEALEQMEMLIMFNHPDVPVPYLRKLIGASLDIVVQQTRLPDGQRKVTAITEVVPDRQEGYKLQDIAVFKQTGLNERGKIAGTYQMYPVSERIAQRLERLNLPLPLPARPAQRTTRPDSTTQEQQ